MDATKSNITFPEELLRSHPHDGRKNRSPKDLVSRQTRGLREPITAEQAQSIQRRPIRRDPATFPIYANMVRELREKYKISIRKWRSEMAGVAYELTYRDGRIKRLIAAPRPRSPVSAAIFLHEVGHHAIGFKRYTQRCLEEHYVWQWAFREMGFRGIPVTARVLSHHRRSMVHYIRHAHARGEHIPAELTHFACMGG
jgi:hypothetical protein